MTPSGDDKRPKQASTERGVLSSLPSTRPQRPSARRAAARSKPTEPKASTRRPTTTAERANTARKNTARTTSKPVRTASKRSDPVARAAGERTRTGERRAAEAPPIPRQGFETEEQIAPGSTVEPPSRPELAAAVADLLGELAQGGLTAGGRLLKEVLGRLPGA